MKLLTYFKRMPIIRHIRWFLVSWEFYTWWNGVGVYFWIEPNPADLQYLQDVWDGKE